MNNVDYQTIVLPGFVLQGLSAEILPTSDPSEVIGKLWQEFAKGDFSNKIPEMTRGIILSVYTNYLHKDHSAYTIYVGCKVSEELAVVPGLGRVEVPGSTFAMFLARGPMPQSVSDAWQQINAKNLDRAYRADYDIYGPKSQNHSNSEVEIFVSVN